MLEAYVKLNQLRKTLQTAVRSSEKTAIFAVLDKRACIEHILAES